MQKLFRCSTCKTGVVIKVMMVTLLLLQTVFQLYLLKSSQFIDFQFVLLVVMHLKLKVKMMKNGALKAKEYVSNMVMGKLVTLEDVQLEKYRRLLTTVLTETKI